MKKVDARKIQVLKCIVETFIKTGDVIGSKTLLDQYDLGVSSATIRNDMAALEKMGLIFQPYNSAGRLPTNRGIRVFVDYLMEDITACLLQKDYSYQEIDTPNSIEYTLRDIVTKLSSTTHELAFACVPERGALQYTGASYLIKKSKDYDDIDLLSIIEIMEDIPGFLKLVSSLDVGNKVGAFIGEEHIGGKLKNTTIILKKIQIQNYIGYLGLIGPIKMDYAFNIASLRQIL